VNHRKRIALASGGDAVGDADTEFPGQFGQIPVGACSYLQQIHFERHTLFYGLGPVLDPLCRMARVFRHHTGIPLE
jgi:hypothetical protein